MEAAPIQRLIERAAAGDAAAFEHLLHELQGGLLAFIDRIMPAGLRTLVEPRDVLHDTCFEAFRRIGTFHAADPDAAHRWLATIARHQVVDLARAHARAKRGGRRQLAGEDDMVVRLLAELAVHERTPSRSAMRHELAAAIEEAIDRLAPPLREALRLRHVTGLPFAAVADRMGRTERAAQQLCTRALAALRLDLRSASLFF